MGNGKMDVSMVKEHLNIVMVMCTQDGGCLDRSMVWVLIYGKIQVWEL